MKPFLCSLLCACLLKVLISGPVGAIHITSERDLSATAWVQSPCATFEMRTYQDAKGDLIVQVNNRSGRDLAVTLQTDRSEKLAYVPISRQQGVFTVKLDVTEIPAGLYRVAIVADTEKAVQLVRLLSPATQPHYPSKLVVMLAQ